MANNAKDKIKAYLDKRAAEDEQFAQAYAKPNKSIDECFNYILGEARKQGTQVCMTDEEVYGLAVHYYDEDEIKVENVPSGTYRAAATTAPVELTEEEKAQAKARAMQRLEEQCMAEQIAENKKTAAKPKKQQSQESPSLFDF